MSHSGSIAGKVSIVIPCFNHGATLRETLASIEAARQTSLVEVIIVNDGSTDPNTCRLFEELAGSRYTIFHQPNRGLGAARNAGVRLAQGEFILPLDSDNRIRSTYLTCGVEVLLKNPRVGVVYGDAEFFGEHTGRSVVPEFDLIHLIQGNYIDACAVYRKSAWESVHGYDEKMPWMGYEDWDFWQRVAAQGWQFHHLDEIAFDYRVSGSSMLQSVTNHRQDELRAYIAGKRESQLLQLVVKKELELQRLREIAKSKDYRLGKWIVNPVRQIKRLFSGQKNLPIE
jgi:glycosyltransferase involved in cell wall biosynthesis